MGWGLPYSVGWGLPYYAGWGLPYYGGWGLPYYVGWGLPYAVGWGLPYAVGWGLPYYVGIHPPQTSLKYFQTGSDIGAGAVIFMDSPETGCVNCIARAWRWMLPSGLLRLKPYFKSPLMGQPMSANITRIW